LYAGYGEANFSRRNRFIFSPVYDLPNFYHGGGVLGKFTGGWGLSGVLTLQSGTPLTFLNTNSENLLGTTSDFAYLNPTNTGCNGSINIGGSVRSRLSQYFNVNCFTNPPVISSDGGTAFGNTKPGMLRGPSQHNLDLSLRKNTPLTERINLEFRAEFFNAFNSTQYANPDTSYSDGVPAFGAITATSVAARVGQLALKLHF
jgi:hypothetical protein